MALAVTLAVLLIIDTFIVPLGIVTFDKVKLPRLVAVFPRPTVVLPRVILPLVIAVLEIAIATLDAVVTLPLASTVTWLTVVALP